MPYEIIENEKYLTECEIRNFKVMDKLPGKFGEILLWHASLL